MDIWEKAKAMSSIIAAIFLPVVLLMVGNNYSGAIKERELQGRFVELAVNILKEQPSEATRNLRDWATEVVSRYSGVPLSPATRKDLIEKTPLPSALTPSMRYEGRQSLGNTVAGDGARFLGRGYLMLTGRANYTAMSQALGVDLVSDPDQAATPDVAARIFIAFLKPQSEKLRAALDADDDTRAWHFISGSGNGLDRVRSLRDAYRSALRNSGGGTLSMPGITNPDWPTVHVPALLAAMDAGGVTDEGVRAFLLAVADFETEQGKIMVEIDR